MVYSYCKTPVDSSVNDQYQIMNPDDQISRQPDTYREKIREF